MENLGTELVQQGPQETQKWLQKKAWQGADRSVGQRPAEKRKEKTRCYPPSLQLSQGFQKVQLSGPKGDFFFQN